MVTFLARVDVWTHDVYISSPIPPALSRTARRDRGHQRMEEAHNSSWFHCVTVQLEPYMRASP